MKAAVWAGVNEVAVEDVPEPRLLNDQDVILKVSKTVTCGSDLHLIGGYIPAMRTGDVLGHEFIGEVVEAGPRVTEVRVGDRVVVPSFVTCGSCWYCRQELYSLCDNGNPDPGITEGLWGQSPGGWGGTKPGDVVAVWGAGAVGQMAARAAMLLGAEEVVVIDRIPERLAQVRQHVGAEAVDDTGTDVVAELRERTGGRGPDVCIEAVGMEARAVMNKGLTLRGAQQHGQRYVPEILGHMERGELTTEHLATHTMPLSQAAEGYRIFKEKTDGCVRAVFEPGS